MRCLSSSGRKSRALGAPKTVPCKLIGEPIKRCAKLIGEPIEGGATIGRYAKRWP